MPDTEMRFRTAGAVKALTERRLEVLACPYGGPDDRDKLGEYFSARTEFMLEEGDRRPTLYFHGFAPNKKMTALPAPIGVATTTRRDEAGVWMEVELKATPMADRIWEAAKAGNCRASTGAVNYLCRSDRSGEVRVWPIGELSLLDEGLDRHPVNDKAVALPLRATFDAIDLKFPEAFGEDATEQRGDTGAIRTSENTLGVTTMPTEIELAVKAALDARDAEAKAAATRDADAKVKATLAAEKPAPEVKPIAVGEEQVQVAVKAILDARAAAEAAKKAERDAIKAELLAEMKNEPSKYRASVLRETGGLILTPDEAKRGLTLEDKKEIHEFFWKLRKMPHLLGNGVIAENRSGNAMRVLEETEAAEGLPLVPQDALNQIISMRDEVSLVAKIGITRYSTDRLIFNLPRETTAMGALAAIAEEGAYVANEPAFTLTAVTVAKYGSMITATEELLEDQNLFQTWFTAACSRSWGLAENTALFTFLKAGGTSAVHSATFTDPELMTFFFNMLDPWRDNMHFIAENATVAAMRALLVATPRAYGEFPSFGGGAFPTWMGAQVHMNSNWETIGGGDTTLTATLLNPAAVGWVERRGLVIKVDPYGDALNGRVRYFPSARFAGAITQTLGVQHYTDHA